MLSLDDPRWSTLEGGYKVVYDPRPALEQLRAGNRKEEAWSELWNELHHQGDIGPASYAAVPHIIDIYARADEPDWNALALVGLIEDVRLQSGPKPPAWLWESYMAAIHRLPELGARDLLRSDDSLVVRSALAAIAIAKGLRATAQMLTNYSDDELGEMERLYQESPAER